MVNKSTSEKAAPAQKKVSDNNTVMPEPLPFSLTTGGLTINTTCGTCKHLTHIPHPAYKEVCATKGIFDTNKPCKRYSVDTRQIPIKNNEDIIALAALMARIPKKSLPLVAALANRESRTRRSGYVFGQIVFIRILGNDYISNYRRCRVTEANKDYVFLEGADGFSAMVHHSSILTTEKWLEKKAHLKKLKKIVDPKYQEYFTAPSKAAKEANKILDSLTPPDLTVAMKGKKILLSAGSTKEKQRNIVFSARELNPDTTPVDKLLKTPLKIRMRG